MSRPQAPRLFLVDGYALIYRAFFALGQQPLRSSRGENTSIARGTNDFITKLIETHKPEYLGWVHDKGLSFRHELYPAYKATRERLEPEQQVDFDEGVARVEELLAGCDLLLVIGTSAGVYPAAGLPALVKDRGGLVYEFNREPALAAGGFGRLPLVDFFFQGDLAETLPMFGRAVFGR